MRKAKTDDGQTHSLADPNFVKTVSTEKLSALLQALIDVMEIYRQKVIDAEEIFKKDQNILKDLKTQYDLITKIISDRVLEGISKTQPVFSDPIET